MYGSRVCVCPIMDCSCADALKIFFQSLLENDPQKLAQIKKELTEAEKNERKELSVARRSLFRYEKVFIARCGCFTIHFQNIFTAPVLSDFRFVSVMKRLPVRPSVQPSVHLSI